VIRHGDGELKTVVESRSGGGRFREEAKRRDWWEEHRLAGHGAVWCRGWKKEAAH